MQAIISRSEYVKSLRAALSHFGDKAPAVVHTDLLHVGILERRGSKEEVCAAHFEALKEAFGDRPLIFPVFNYDFYKTRLYKTLDDPCQVGVLNEYIRQQHPEKRSHTPVFNFVLCNDDGFDSRFHANPYGSEDIFAQVMRRDGIMVCLGAPLSNSTFQHVAEHSHAVPYRYQKPFRGRVEAPEGACDVLFEPDVFPMDEESRSRIAYRWDHLQEKLQKDGSLVSSPLGRGNLIVYSAVGCHDLYSRLLRSNILYALTPESQEAVWSYLKSRKIDRMTLANMEPDWVPDIDRRL